MLVTHRASASGTSKQPAPRKPRGSSPLEERGGGKRQVGAKRKEQKVRIGEKKGYRLKGQRFLSLEGKGAKTSSVNGSDTVPEKRSASSTKKDKEKESSIRAGNRGIDVMYSLPRGEGLEPGYFTHYKKEWKTKDKEREKKERRGEGLLQEEEGFFRALKVRSGGRIRREDGVSVVLTIREGLEGGRGANDYNTGDGEVPYAGKAPEKYGH